MEQNRHVPVVKLYTYHPLLWISASLAKDILLEYSAERPPATCQLCVSLTALALGRIASCCTVAGFNGVQANGDDYIWRGNGALSRTTIWSKYLGNQHLKHSSSHSS